MIYYNFQLNAEDFLCDIESCLVLFNNTHMSMYFVIGYELRGF
jgi:hypothetical protein